MLISNVKNTQESTQKYIIKLYRLRSNEFVYKWKILIYAAACLEDKQYNSLNRDTQRHLALMANSQSLESQPVLKNFVPYKPKKNEVYMNEKQREHFNVILLDWREQLMQEVDRTVHHMQDDAANYPDPADRATQEEEFSLELRTRDRERKLIKKIDSTIELIAQDDYGYCDSCGIDIGIRRLEARPTANKCIDCKTLDEIKEKQLGS